MYLIQNCIHIDWEYYSPTHFHLSIPCSSTVNYIVSMKYHIDVLPLHICFIHQCYFFNFRISYRYWFKKTLINLKETQKNYSHGSWACTATTWKSNKQSLKWPTYKYQQYFHNGQKCCKPYLEMTEKLFFQPTTTKKRIKFSHCVTNPQLMK